MIDDELIPCWGMKMPGTQTFPTSPLEVVARQFHTEWGGVDEQRQNDISEENMVLHDKDKGAVISSDEKDDELKLNDYDWVYQCTTGEEGTEMVFPWLGTDKPSPMKRTPKKTKQGVRVGKKGIDQFTSKPTRIQPDDDTLAEFSHKKKLDDNTLAEFLSKKKRGGHEEENQEMYQSTTLTSLQPHQLHSGHLISKASILRREPNSSVPKRDPEGTRLTESYPATNKGKVQVTNNDVVGGETSHTENNGVTKVPFDESRTFDENNGVTEVSKETNRLTPKTEHNEGDAGLSFDSFKDEPLKEKGQDEGKLVPDALEANEEKKSDEDDETVCRETKRVNSMDFLQEIKMTNSMKLLDEMALGEWSNFSLTAFVLQPLPHTLSNPALLDQCHVMDDKLWKLYYGSRCLLANACLVDANNKDSADATDKYIRDLKEAFHIKWKSTALGAVMSKHTFQRAARVSKSTGGGGLEDATIVSTIFSPYLLPHAIQFCHQYRRKEQTFKCSFRIQFVNFRNHTSPHELMIYCSPSSSSASDICELCSNSYLSMPTNEVGWMEIENIETSSFTPKMVHKIRKWLFGHCHSLPWIQDMELLSFLFGSCGAVDNFNIYQGDIGYTWKASVEDAKDMQVYGSIEDTEIVSSIQTGITWLEFHCRLASGSLRPIDHWYENYNQKYYKGLWGAKVLQHRYEHEEFYEQDDEVRENPWMLWDISRLGYPCTTSLSAQALSESLKSTVSTIGDRTTLEAPVPRETRSNDNNVEHATCGITRRLDTTLLARRPPVDPMERHRASHHLNHHSSSK